MNDLTDYEVNKRLAEIAGVGGKYWPGRALLIVGERTEEWNPLHNWSQLGPLMERFGVQVEPGFNGSGPPKIWFATVFGDDDTFYEFARDDLKRAIALAIIAAFEEE